MKSLRIIPLFLFTMTALPGFAGCSPAEFTAVPDIETPVPDPGPEPKPDPEPGNGRYLAVYFSRSGYTKSVVDEIGIQTDATTIEVVPAVPYPNDYNATLTRARQEIAAIDDSDTYPAVETVVEDFDAYEVIFICTPLWYGRMATPVQSFLHAHAEKLRGKTVALAVTSASTGISAVVSDARRLCSGSVFRGEPLWVRNSEGGTLQERIAEWVENLGIGGEKPDSPDVDADRFSVVVGSASFEATLADNAAAAAFKAMLPMEVSMNELNGNEKYYYMPTGLPAAASSPGTIQAGDLMLYGSDCVVLFYKTFATTYNYTRLGYLDDPSQLESALGPGGATVRFEMVRQ